MFSHFLRKLGTLTARPSAVTVAGGLVWETTPAGDSLFGPSGPDLPAWLADGSAVEVKRNLQRVIYRVRRPGGVVYIKHCRANTPRAVAREILRPAKARLEFENAVHLRRLGIATIEPLAWGGASRWRPGDSYLITLEAADAEPFVDRLERPYSPAARRRLAEQLARFLATLHDAGVTHPDPHPGNLLVESGSTFVLADLHAVHFGQPLTWVQTRDNLVLFNRFFQVRSTRTDRLRFWRAYLVARRTLTGTPSAEAKLLERDTAASNARFWAARVSRYTADNRESRRVHGPAADGYAVRDLPADVLRGWLTDPDAAFRDPSAVVLKDSRTSTVAALTMPTPTGPQVVVYKRFNLKQMLGPVKNLLRPSPALRSWLAGNGVRDRGLPTARPLAVFHRRRLGAPTVGYAVCELVPDARPLPEAVAALDTLSPAERRAVLRSWTDKLGRLVRQLHERQVAHRDLKASNILLSGPPLTAEPVLIDLVGVETGRPVPERTRVRDLARLTVSFLDSPRVSRADRLRFLRAYLNWGLAGRVGWKRWWAGVAGATAAKVARNARTGRPLG
jgi:tRNA A-37 threonylcarbamoyl transferase component Bud32